MNRSDKFLVSFIQSLSHRQIFFMVWMAIVGVFVLLMVGHYRKRTQRNFRDDGMGTKGTPFPKQRLTKTDSSAPEIKRPKLLGK